MPSHPHPSPTTSPRLTHLARRNGYIKPYQDFDSTAVADGLLNFIVCVEMLILGIMHHIAFGVHEFWVPGRGALGSLAEGLLDAPLIKLGARDSALHVLPVGDLHAEAKHAVKGLRRRPAAGDAGTAGAEKGAVEVVAVGAGGLCLPTPAAVAPLPAAAPGGATTAASATVPAAATAGAGTSATTA